MITKSIKINAEIFPHSKRVTQAEIEEITKIDEFIKAIEDAAKKYLPISRSMIKIEEVRESETR